MANRQPNIDPKAMVKNLASRGVTLPRHEQRKLGAAVEMHHIARNRGDLEETIRRHYASSVGTSSQEVDQLTKNNELIRQMGLSRAMRGSGRKMESSRRREKTSSMGSSGSFMDDVSLALPRFYDPLEFWDVAGLPWNMADEGHRHKLHKWLRLYYATHYLVPILIDIFTRFPLVGMEIETKDTQLTKFYEDLFLDKLDYENFLVSVGREFWCSPPGQEVKTKEGYKPIEKIGIGDYVLTHRGRYRKVLKTSERPYKGKIRTLTPYKAKPTTFTHGHEIFTGIMSGHLDIDEQWTPIEDLSKGDYVCIPRDPGDKHKNIQSWTPIKKIEDEDYDGPVYNLEVEEDHSYVTSIAVHNCVGEAFPLASFDEDLGVWEHEELLNPEDIVIKNFPLLDSSQLYVVPPAYLTKLSREKAPAREYKMLQMQYPELIPYLLKNEHIPVSGVLLKQIGNKLTDWDDHGTPILLRSLRTLMHEEKLWASQEAVAERLYSPFILAKVGIQDLGDGQPPWIPEPEHLEIVRDDIDLALASDFRLMVHHFGIDIQNVFGREQMPRLGDDFDRVERRILMCISGDTLVHTKKGVFPAKTLKGEVEVLSLGGVYRKSYWDDYGEQDLYEIKLENGDNLQATLGHEWIVKKRNGRSERVTTDKLIGRRIPMQYLDEDFIYDDCEWLQGVRNGLVYGDGSLYSSGGKKYATIPQFSSNKHLIYEYFDNPKIHKIGYDHAAVASGLPAEYKNLPPLTKSESYLRGFIAGFIAAEGSVDDTGHVKAFQSSYDDLVYIREICKRAKIPTICIKMTMDAGAERCMFNPQTRQMHTVISTKPNYRLSFAKAAFFRKEGRGYDPKLILKREHRKYAAQCSEIRKRYSIKVIDVVPTGNKEKVYCCVEPETHSFVIENHYLTGNCFGVNPSLLSAGAATQPYASSALQAEFLNQMLRTYQGVLKRHFRERAAIVAEAQEHYDYEKRGSTRVPLYEEVVVYDEEGNKHIETRPKLLLPSMKMQTLDLRDEATERQFMQALRAQGVPISDERLMVGVDFSPKEEAEKYNEETLQKTLIQQEAKFKTYTILKTKNLPIPPELAAEVEGVLLPQAQGGMAGGQQQPQVLPGGQQNPSQMPGKGGAPQLGPGGIGNPMAGGGAPPATPEPATGPTGGSTAPPVSMERRQGLPRPASSVQKKSEDNMSQKEKNNDLDKSDKISSEEKEKAPEKIVQKLPVNKTTKKRYTIIDEDQRIPNSADTPQD